MRKIFLLLSLVFAHSLLANEQTEVHLMSEGSCLITLSKSSLSMSSFSEYASRRISFQELDMEMNNIIKSELSHLGTSFKEDVQNASKEYFVHCGAYGLSLITKIKGSNSDLCVWAKLDRQEFKMRSLGYLSKSEMLSDNCHGKKFGDLLLNISDSELEGLLLSDPKWSQIIKSYKVISQRLVKIELESEYWLKEETIKEELLSEFKKLIKSIDLNGYTHPRGDFLPIK